MKISEFLRWLRSQGVQIEHGTRHYRLKVPNRPPQTLPRHPSQELNEGIRKNIIRDLGLKK